MCVALLAFVLMDVVRHRGDAAAGLRTEAGPERTSKAERAEPQGEGPPPLATAPVPQSAPAQPAVEIPTGTGSFTTAPGQSERFGSSAARLLRYQVQVEDGTEQDVAEFANAVDGVLSDTRSWIAGGDVALQRVAERPDFVIYLASPATVDKLCYPLDTAGYTSCRVGEKVVINLARWLTAVPHFDADLATYRQYVVNHEVGHQLGHEHEQCPAAGQPAPVMQQQTLDLAGCHANAWPFVDGARYQGPPV